MKHQLLPGQPFAWFLIIWTLLNAFTAAFLELDPDEAYYWVYARQLDWGYFDHPPAIAVLIRFGSSWMAGALGVRLGAVILQTLSFWLVWVLCDKPKEKQLQWVLIALLAGVPILQLFGFIATPDAPLLFFTVLFFVVYRSFLREAKWITTLALGLVMALLLYSKYHGILLILLTLFSNPRLLTHPRFYLASIFGAFLFLPHLYWQYLHDFPSFRYHLQGRDDPYELKHTITYIINQLVIFSPFLFPFMVKALARPAVKNQLTRAYLFVLTGFWLFFLLSTRKGHVEPQWTAILSIPLIVMTFQYARGKVIFTKWVIRKGLLSFVLLLAFRILLIPDYDPPEVLDDLHGAFHDREWVQALETEAGDLPVVFQNSYRDAGKYWFYTGDTAYTFTDVYYRKNQFDIWDWEKSLNGKDVLLVGNVGWNCTDCLVVYLDYRQKRLKTFRNLPISQKVTIQFDPISTTWQAGGTRSLEATIINPYDHSIELESQELPLAFWAIFQQTNTVKGLVPMKPESELLQLSPNSATSVRFQFQVPDELNGKYDFGLGISTGDLPTAENSKKVQVEVYR